MAQIILNHDQAQALKNATGAVEPWDEHGNFLGYISLPFTSERIAEAKRRAASDGPWYTTDDVLHKLEILEVESAQLTPDE